MLLELPACLPNNLVSPIAIEVRFIQAKLLNPSVSTLRLSVDNPRIKNWFDMVLRFGNCALFNLHQQYDG